MKTMADSNMVRESLLGIADPEDAASPATVVAEDGPDLAMAESEQRAASIAQPGAGTGRVNPPHVTSALSEPGIVAAPRTRATPGGYRRLIPLAAVSLAVFASSVSVIGILVASRMVARTNVVLEQIEAHQGKVRQLDALIVEVDGLRRREQIALERLERLAVGKPATAEEVRAAIGGLQLAMARSQAGGSMGIMTSLRDAQVELAERISTIYRRVERIDEKVGTLVSSSPKARRAGDPAPTF